MKHGIVIGGSMGGLLAARVLSSHFERVTLIERDRFPPIGEQRRGVPQGRHTHGLLSSGAQVLESHFPGLKQELVDLGAVPGDVVQRGRWFHEGGYLAQVQSGLDGILASRPLLEGIVRRRVFALPNIQVLEDCEVDGLESTADRAQITGVRLKDGRILAADLVVNSCGRGSHSPDWLENLGYAKPATDRVNVALGYTTRLFRRNPSELDGDLAVIVPATPEGRKGGVMIAQEGGRWTVTLMSYFGNYAPTDLAGFREFARGLHAPDIDEVIRTAEPIGEPQVARFPASIRHRYEKLDRFPAGYLVFGDAICSFNPIYGQGMSVACLESAALDACLSGSPAGLAKRFFQAAAKVVDIPWSIATGSDLRIPQVEGPRPAAARFINWYIAKLHRAAHHDPVLSVAFHRVANLLDPPPSLMRPAMALRVLKSSLQTQKGEA